MPSCPRCRTQVSVPARTWIMSGRPDRSGFRAVLTLGLFNCPSCGRPFRAILNRTTEPAAEATNLRICPECGTPNSRDRDYCSQCGTLFNQEGISP